MSDHYDNDDAENLEFSGSGNFAGVDMTGRNSFSVSVLEHIKKLEAKVEALEQSNKTISNEADEGTTDQDDEREKYPSDCYSMMALNGPSMWGSSKNSFFFFLYGSSVFWFQITFLCLMLYSQMAVKRGTVEESDNPDFGESSLANLIAPNAQNVVIAAQVVSIMAYVLFPESTMVDVVNACRLFPQGRGIKGQPFWWLRLISILRGGQGVAAIIVAWILVMTSGTPVDIILNFTAINFVSGLDDAAFTLADSGVFGPVLEKEVKRVAETPLPPNVSTKRPHIWYWGVMAVTFVSCMAVTLAALLFQASDQTWISQAVRVEFNSKSFAKYSGCFQMNPDATRNYKRYTYHSINEGSNTSIGYCREDRQWILFYGQDNNFDPCEANNKDLGVEIARSADTDSFDVSAIFDERWASSSGAPLDLFFFQSTDEEELHCHLHLGDGICNEVFNDPGYDYDQGDCCAATCQGSKCGKGGYTSAFGASGLTGIGFPSCDDEDMVPITIQLNGFSNSRELEEWPGDYCESKYYISEDEWRTKTPEKVLFDLDCDGKPVMTVYVDQSMEGMSETVMVEDGANCTLLARNNTRNNMVLQDHDFMSCFARPIWFLNYTLFHGDSTGMDSDSVEILTHQSVEADTVNFKRFPNCYFRKLRERFKLSTLYTAANPHNKAVDWLSQDIPAVSTCDDDLFIHRFDLVYLYFATDPEINFINRGKHCSWHTVTCDLKGNINQLDLHSTGLKGAFPIPYQVKDFAFLRGLDIFDNALTSIQSNIGRMTNLTYIDMDDNEIEYLPTEIGNMESLEGLFFSGNNIELVPTEIGQMSNLKRLHMSTNQIASIPTEIGLLTNVFQFESYENIISSIPSEIGLMESLEELYLQNNEIQSIPTEIGLLTNLQKLNLGNNQLSSIPTEIGLLTNLSKLTLDGNNITCDELPENIYAVCSDLF